jgi:hypothetical protein
VGFMELLKYENKNILNLRGAIFHCQIVLHRVGCDFGRSKGMSLACFYMQKII